MKLAAILALLVLAPAAAAGEIRFHFLGSVTTASNPNGAYAGVQVGDAVDLVCEVDTLSPTIVAPGQYVQYTVDTATMSLHIGAMVVPYTGGAPAVGMINAFPVSDGVQDVGASMGSKTLGYSVNHNSGLWTSTDPFQNLGTHPIVVDGSFSYSFSVTGGGSFIEFFPSSIVVERIESGVNYCFGDGSGTACPCGNSSVVGTDTGCQNSLGLGGKLRAYGAASLSNDVVRLDGSQMPNSSALYFQGTTQTSVAFGDGLRCAGGSIIRLGTKSNVNGASQYPAAGDPSVSMRGLVTAPGLRTYQCWYRNAAAFCTVSTFNLTNGIAITWSA
jgi:hypothetical protein